MPSPYILKIAEQLLSAPADNMLKSMVRLKKGVSTQAVSDAVRASVPPSGGKIHESAYVNTLATALEGLVEDDPAWEPPPQTRKEVVKGRVNEMKEFHKKVVAAKKAGKKP
jgi:hypothetical protein